MICDRFTDSTRVYQGVLGSVDAQLIRALERITVGDTQARPHLHSRRAGRGRAARAPRSGAATRRADRFEGEALEFHEKLRDAFRSWPLQRAEPLRADRRRRSDAAGVAEQIWSVVNERLDPATAPVAFEERRIVSADARPTTTSAIPHPRETSELFGHAEAEQTLLDAYRGGRMPHAWLIGGPAGIGKATLAYRMARFVLAHPDPAAPAVQAGDIARGRRPIIRSRGASPAQAHSDLLVLERVDQREDRQAVHRDPGRRCAPHGAVLRLDRGRGRLAGRHRRYRRRAATPQAPTRC